MTPQIPPTRPDLDTLLDMAIATGGETDRFELKEHLDLGNPEHQLRLVRAVASFANTDSGGFLVIGVSNDRRVVGLPPKTAQAYDQTRVHRLVSSYLAPAPVLQVRHHQRDSCRVVIVEIEGFRAIPCVLVKSKMAGKVRVEAGTILTRTPSAESTAICSELQMRRLCDAIVSRRASDIIELFHRGTRFMRWPVDQAAEDRLVEVQRLADTYWPSTPGSKPYIEVAFATQEDLKLSPNELKLVFPSASIPIEHGFPFHDVHGLKVHTPMPWGWLGVIPYVDQPTPKKPPSYLWLLTRAGSFLDREYLWEDEPRSVIPGGVGIYHLAGRVILLLRFAAQYSAKLSLPRDTALRVQLRATNVRGRCLQDETSRHPRLIAETAPENTVCSALDTRVGAIISDPTTVALNLLEEVTWQFRRTEWNRQYVAHVLANARNHLGSEFTLPKTNT